MRLPGRHSLLWKLTGALALFCLLLVSLHVDLERLFIQATSRLPASTQAVLRAYGQEAEAAWRDAGTSGIDAFLARLREREQVWAVVVDGQQRTLSSQPLDEDERARLHFVRRLDWLVGRPGGTPTFYVPFSDGESRLVMNLPQRLNPRQHLELWNLLLQRIVPALLAVLLGLLLYRLLIAPLAILRRQANALHADDLSARAGGVARRRDELGELARAFDHMAERLQATVSLQRQLLRDVSHELRTPLSRLRVAGESGLDAEQLSQRVLQEVDGMQRLVAATLELAWLDTERPRLTAEQVELAALWDVLAENVRFESGWSGDRLRYEVSGDCRLHCNLNALAQALENVLRNAVRHSPAGGTVRLGGRREGAGWHLWLSDEGPGVAETQLEAIFLPFTRLDGSRPGDGGFGLGLSIARSAIAGQGGRIWAENGAPGLCVHFQLPAA